MTTRHANLSRTIARAPRALARGVRRAFTIFELLITIGIIVLATAIVIPAFGRIIESSNFAGAVNTVTATLGNARALAIRNNNYTAVAFLFDTDTETYTLLPLELFQQSGGSLALYAPSSPAVNTYSYRPADATAPVRLPKGIGVYGLTFLTEPAGALIDNGTGGIQATRAWYAGEQFVNSGNQVRPWIFPRNDPRLYYDGDMDPYDAIRAGVDLGEVDTAQRHAQSFMIQFSPVGTVVDSFPAAGVQIFTAYIEYPDRPRDEVFGTVNPETGEIMPYDDLYAFDPENRDTLSQLENAEDNPEVVLRNVSQLAVVSLDDMRKGVPELGGATEVWFVRPAESFTGNQVAPLRTDLDNAGVFYEEATTIAVSRWIDNNAEIISFNRYTGNIIRRSN